MRRALPVVILFLLCLPVTQALYGSGFYVSHDGEFNLVRLMHFYNELTSGQFPVRWAFDLNYRFGSPVFSFFYPLMYYLGSSFHFLGFDFGTSLKAVILLATYGSVFSMYVWLKNRFSTLASMVGSLLFVYVPYRLLTMYVTGSFGVLLSLMFVPIAFLAIDRIRRRGFVAVLSVGVLGILTAHNVTALLLLPVVIIYAAVSILTGKEGRKITEPILIGFILGLGLSAFFILPALLETGNVFLSEGVVVNFREHFPSLSQLIYSPWGYFYSVAGVEGDGMSFQVGLAQLIITAMALPVVAFWLFKRKLNEKNQLALVFLLITLASILMMLPISSPIWESIPLLAQIQFPWRLLVIPVVCTPFLAAYLVDHKYGKIIALVLIGIMAWNNRNYLRTWEVVRYPDASYLERDSLYYGSTDIAWETRPIWAEKKPVWIASGLVEPNDELTLKKQERIGTEIAVVVNGSQPTTLEFSQFYYPTFRVTLDGEVVKAVPSDGYGRLSIDLPLSVKLEAGDHEIRARQERSNLMVMADLISLLSLGGVVFTLWKSRP